MNITNFHCPLCDAALMSQRGHQLSPTEGVTVYCANPDCPAAEVFGHARNEKEAIEIIKSRYKRE